MPMRSLNFQSLQPWIPGVVVLCLGLAGLLAFGDALAGDRVFAARDAVHTFPGLVGLIRQEWSVGRVPLWNPWLNNGQPLAAMNVAGALYPPQVLAALALPTGAASTTLVVGHLLLAAAAATRIALDAGRSSAAAAVAGLAYAFSGSVVFQAYHPNIAAGVAWLAWAVCFGIRLGHRWSPGAFLGLAASLACAVLAGDPQAAYLAGITLVVWRIGAGVSAGAAGATTILAAGRLGAAAVLAAALAWPQIALTSEFMATTTRYADAYPVSIWDVPRCLRDPDAAVRNHWADVILGRPPPESSFYHQIYRFSVAPWRVLDLVNPTLAGPLDDRWTSARGLEGDVWVATLYSGVVPLAACLLALGHLRREAAVRRWSLVIAAAFAASLGGLGAVGIARRIAEYAATGGVTDLYRPGDEVGGIAWLLTSFVPGYAGFRSPGKWLACFALGLAQLAAAGIDVSTTSPGRGTLRRWLWAVGGASIVVTLAAGCMAPSTALPGVVSGCVLCLSAAVLAALLLDTRLVPSWLRGREAAALAVVTAVELAVAARATVESAPLAAVRGGSGYLETLEPLRDPRLASASAHPRLAAIDGLIEIPQSANATARARAVGVAQRCNTPLLHGWGKVGEPGTAMEADFELLCSPISTPNGPVFPRQTLDRSAVEFFVIPASGVPGVPLDELLHEWSGPQQAGVDRSIVPAGAALPNAAPPGEPLVRVIRNVSARPRVRITRDLLAVPPFPEAPRRRRVAALRPLAFPDPTGGAPAATVVESADAVAVAAIAEAREAATGADEAARITIDEPRRVVIDVELAAPACVVLADTFHADWTATVRVPAGGERRVEILRADHTLRGCLLPAGRQTIEFRHRSATFARAIPVAILAWAGVIVAALTCRQGRQPRLVEPSTRTNSAGLVRPA